MYCMKSIDTERVMLLSTSIAVVALFISGAAWAHDPIFGLGPHVLYKGGVEVAPTWRKGFERFLVTSWI